MVIYIGDRFTDRGIGFYREHWTEDLLSHYREPVIRIHHKHWHQLAIACGGRLAYLGELDHSHAGASRFLDISQDPFIVRFIDQASVIGVVVEVRIHPADRLTG